MLILPKYRDIVLSLNNCWNAQGHTVPNMQHSMMGEYRLIRYNSMGQVNYDTGWVRNLITDYGLTAKTLDGGFASYFYIGSGTTPPQVTDTAMDSFLGYSSLSQGSTERNTNPVAPFYEMWNQKAMRFAAGVGTGTINEVGIGSNTVGGELFARQLVVPGVPKAADEVVDVIWRITMFPDLTEKTGTVVDDGITFDWTLRPLGVTTHSDFAGTFGRIGTMIYIVGMVSDNDLVPITNSALGTVGTNNVNYDYGESGNGYWDSSTGSVYRVFGYRWQLNNANLVNGIKTFRIGHSGPDMYYQVRMVAQSDTGAGNPQNINKDETKELTIYHRADWARRP